MSLNWQPRWLGWDPDQGVRGGSAPWKGTDRTDGSLGVASAEVRRETENAVIPRYAALIPSDLIDCAVSALPAVEGRRPGIVFELSSAEAAVVALERDGRAESAAWREAVSRLRRVLEEIVAPCGAPPVPTLPDLPEKATSAVHFTFADASVSLERVI